MNSRKKRRMQQNEQLKVIEPVEENSLPAEIGGLRQTMKATAPNIVDDVLQTMAELKAGGKNVNFFTFCRLCIKKVFGEGGAIERTGQQHPELLPQNNNPKALKP